MELTEECKVLQRLRSKEDASKDRVWGLIRKGFEMDVSGVKLAKASGLSQSRVYQIREEGYEQDAQEAAAASSD